jgi:hypothetical protein
MWCGSSELSGGSSRKDAKAQRHEPENPGIEPADVRGSFIN